MFISLTNLKLVEYKDVGASKSNVAQSQYARLISWARVQTQFAYLAFALDTSQFNNK